MICPVLRTLPGYRMTGINRESIDRDLDDWDDLGSETDSRKYNDAADACMNQLTRNGGKAMISKRYNMILPKFRV